MAASQSTNLERNTQGLVGLCARFHYTPRFEFRLLRSIWSEKKANETHQIGEAESCILSQHKIGDPLKFHHNTTSDGARLKTHS